MVFDVEPILPQSVLRNIGDKIYEKRKAAALEVEQVHPAVAQRCACCQCRTELLRPITCGQHGYPFLENSHTAAAMAYLQRKSKLQGVEGTLAYRTLAR